MSQLIWQHGNYSKTDDGELWLTPYEQDGRMQIYSPCAKGDGKKANNKVQSYIVKEHITNYYIRHQIHYNEPVYMLQLYDYDKSLKPRMYLRYRPPQMYPTAPMHMKVYGY